MPIEALPWTTPALVEKPWLLEQTWLLWLDSVRAALGQVAALVSPPYDTSEVEAAVAATSVTPAAPVTTIYRVSVSVRVTQVATTSSEVQVNVRWTANGVVQTRSSTLLNGNLLTIQESFVVIAETDADTTVAIDTTYTSVGATPMQYRLVAFSEVLL